MFVGGNQSVEGKGRVVVRSTEEGTESDCVIVIVIMADSKERKR